MMALQTDGSSLLLVFRREYGNVHIYISVCHIYIYMHMYIHIYTEIYRERERV